jgi:hypothetical protein
MLKRIGIWVLVLGVSFALFSGCAVMKYKRMYPDYESRVQTLKDMGGEERAPYETAKAENYLRIFYHEVYEDWDAKGAEIFSGKLEQYLEQGMKKVQ